ncbi:MAG: hypothetical protein ISS19_14190 [Bacteroidales bacterium]|nr:hypothetical protein [Bacteroidales bacterium]
MRPLSTFRKVLFTAIAISLPFLLLVLLEGVLRMSGYGDQYPLFIEDPHSPDLLKINPDIAHRYFLNPEAAPNVSFPSFKKDKTDKTIRIVVQGASTTLGVPYMHGGSFPAMLEQRIRFSCPGNEVEVINTSITAVNTYTLLDLADEITEIEPDAVIIYSGHNEYYGALGVASTQFLSKGELLKYFYIVFDDLRLFQLLKNIQKGFARKSSGDVLLNPDKTLMERMVARQSIPYDSELYYAGIRQFDRNLNKLIRIYKDRGIPVLIGTTVSNLKDLEPFISEGTNPGLDSLQSREDALYLVANENMNAMAHFLAGKVYFSEQNFDEARAMFLRARELDQLRFRAPGEINNRIRSVAEKSGIILVDLDSVFAAHSPGGTPGNELITEHVHPNSRGYFLMADAFYNALKDHQIISMKNTVPFKEAFEMMPVTRIDSVYAHLGIRLLTHSWPFTSRELDKDSLLSTLSMPALPDSLGWQVFNKQLDWIEAINLYYTYCMDMKIYHEAIRAAEAMKLELRYSGIPYNMSAKAYGFMNNTNQAIYELKIGYRLEPLPEIAYNLSGNYLKTGNLQESVRYLEYALNGGILFEQGQEKLKILKSTLEMDQQLSTDSTNVLLMLSLARNYVMLNQNAKANQLIKKAIQTDPSHPEVRKLLSHMQNR